MVNITIPSVSLAGMFRVIKKIGDVVTYEGEWQKNLITNNGLDMLGRVTNCMSVLHLSADNSTPTINETQVVSLIRSVAGTPVSLLHPYAVGQPYYSEATFKYSFPPTGEAYNCSKIHLSGGNPDDIFSSALIKDSNNNPTTLSVKAAETLEIIYAVRQYYDTDIKTSTMTLQVDRGEGITEETYDIRVQVFAVGRANINNSGWSSITPYGITKLGEGTSFNYGRLDVLETFFAPNTLPSLTDIIDRNVVQRSSTESYVPNSNKVSGSLKLVRGEANYPNGLRTVAIGSNRGWYCIEYTSQTTGEGIPKTDFDELTLNFEISWGRYEGAL